MTLSVLCGIVMLCVFCALVVPRMTAAAQSLASEHIDTPEAMMLPPKETTEIIANVVATRRGEMFMDCGLVVVVK